MRAASRILGIVALLCGLWVGGTPASAQAPPQPPQPPDSRFSPGEVVDAGHHFFGGVLWGRVARAGADRRTGGVAMGASQRFYSRPVWWRRRRGGPAIRRGNPLHQE